MNAEPLGQAAVRFYLRLLVLLLLPTMAGACAHRTARFVSLPALDAPAAYLKRHLLITESDSRLSGIARLRVQGDKSPFTTKNTFFVSSPDRLRLEVLDFLGRPAFLILIAGKQVTLYDISKNTVYTGTNALETIRFFTGLTLPPGDIVKILLGTPPAAVSDSSRLSWERDGDQYYFEVNNPHSTHSIWIRPSLGRVTQYVLSRDGLPAYELTYSHFMQLGQRFFPCTIRLRYPGGSGGLTVLYESLSTEPAAAGLYRFTPPRGAVHLPLNRFLESRP